MHTQPENRVFYPALDGLRAIAFLIVFFQHYLSLPWGWTGVNVFFVLSGFLITGILFDTRDRPHTARNFYIRRTLRIFPLYYGLFVLLFLVQPLMHWNWTPSWVAWPLYLGNFLRFVSPAVGTPGSLAMHAANGDLGSMRFPGVMLNIGHFWSLCVEEQFYLFWPWVVFLCSRRVLIWICSLTVVIVPLAKVAVAHSGPAWLIHAELLYRGTPFQLDALLLGGLVALLLRGEHRARLIAVGRIVAPIAALVAAVYLAATLQRHGGYSYPEWKFTWGLAFVNLASAAVILCCLQPGSWIARSLGAYPLRWMGRISYGAYVLHDLFHMEYRSVGLRIGQRIAPLASHIGFTTAVIGLVATMVLAWLSFRFFESPFLDLKERWTEAR